ncbi:MAG: low-specificity L-threonine aldolase [Asgard group archaeon]|nr:low-specificity L-threonine aldolase [Asgard group archaeon]
MKQIDFRSDTVTLPTKEMMAAITAAPLGDDVYDEDPTVNTLQQKAAEMFDKEAALLVCSGTMGNICCTVGHTNRGDEIILEKNSHIFLHEVGASAVIGGLQLRTIPGKDGYLITPQQLQNAIRGEDLHYPRTALVCIENTHNLAGGKIWSKKQIDAVAKIAHDNSVKVHIDGARIFNASIALDIPVGKLTKNADSIMFCLSKGLACPIGSMIVGSEEFITKAKRVRKMLGGGMRQAGIIAAPGIVALDSMINRLADDHANAQKLANGLAKIEGIKVRDCPTNLLYIDIAGLNIAPLDLKKKLKKRGIIISTRWSTIIRLVTHYGITEADIDYTLSVFKELFS